MDIKEAVEILTQERDTALPERLRTAYDAVIMALQDGKLFFPSLGSWAFQYKEEK